jgi:fatty acid desaturase
VNPSNDTSSNPSHETASPTPGQPPRHAEWLRASILAGKDHHFLRQSAWRHNVLNLGSFAATVALIGLTVWAGGWMAPAQYLPLAVLSFGLSFFSLFILVVHEASHGMFVIGGNKDQRLFWNRVFGWIVSLPFGVHYIRHWEEGHITHHLKPIEPEDPQAFNRTTGPELWRMVALFLIVPGYAFVHRVLKKRAVTASRTGPGVLIGFLAIWLGAMTATGMTIRWTVPVALLYGLQVTLVLNQLKGALEHGGAIAFDPDPLLRSRTSFFPLRWLFMPWNITLHFEHHLNMAIPWYQLVAYHKAIKPLVPAALHPLIFNRTLLAQLNGQLGTYPEAATATVAYAQATAD